MRIRIAPLVLLLLPIACTLAPSAAPRANAGTASLPTANVARVRDYLERASDLGYSGMWLVAEGDRIVLHEGFGYADREAGIPFTKRTPLPLASIAKQFTAAAVLLLQDEGKLSVQDTLGRFLPGMPADRRGITIHQMLTHTAGLPTYSGPDSEVISRDTLIARMKTVPLSFTPGTRFDYSNAGYSLLAVVVEKASGMPFQRFIEEHLLAPLGIDGITDEPSRFADEVFPLAYSADEPAPRYRAGEGARLPDGPSWNLRGGAGMYTTAIALFEWARAWEVGEVLSDSSRRMAMTPHTSWGAGSSRWYGYGWILNAPPPSIAWHSGGDGMAAIYLTRYLRRGVTMVHFTNHSRGPAASVYPAAQAGLSGGPLPELPVARVSLGRDALRRFTGQYLLASGDTIRVELLNGQLVIPILGRGSIPATTCFPLADSLIMSRVEPAFRALAAGNFAPMTDSLWPGQSLDEELRYWSETWPDWTRRYGEYRGVEFLGTLRGESSLQPDVPIGDNYVLVHFTRGRYLVNVQQDPQGRLFFNTSTTSLLQPRAYYVPQSGTEFLTYNFFLNSPAILRFDTSGRDVRGLRGGCPGSEVAARRLE